MTSTTPKLSGKFTQQSVTDAMHEMQLDHFNEKTKFSQKLFACSQAENACFPVCLAEEWDKAIKVYITSGVPTPVLITTRMRADECFETMIELFAKRFEASE